MSRSGFGGYLGARHSLVVFLTACLLTDVVLGQGSSSDDGGSLIMEAVISSAVFGGVLVLGLIIFALVKCFCTNDFRGCRQKYLEKKRYNLMSERDFDIAADSFNNLVTSVVTRVKICILIKKDQNSEVVIESIEM